MPLPRVEKNDNRKKFIDKCMSDKVMNKEFSDSKQRAAVCYSKWKKAKGTIEITMVEKKDEL